MLQTTETMFEAETSETYALPLRRPTRAQAEDAVRTLVRWAGDRPEREGLRDTPARVVRAYEEWFAGYGGDPAAVLSRTFGEVSGYTDLIVLRDIAVESTCEHHMAPIRGAAHIAYLPAGRVAGISKLARVVDIFARRLQIQERLTAEIARALELALKPRGVAVVIEASHECMSSRGVRKHGARLVTRAVRGLYREADAAREVLALLEPGA